MFEHDVQTSRHWATDGERRSLMNEVHNQDVPDNLPTSKARGQYPRGGYLRLQLYISEHLVLLSFNTSYITAMKYKHIHQLHTPQRRVRHVPVHWIQTPEFLSGIPDLHRYPRVHHLRMESVLFRTFGGIISGQFLRFISAPAGNLPEIPAHSCSIYII